MTPNDFDYVDWRSHKHGQNLDRNRGRGRSRGGGRSFGCGQDSYSNPPQKDYLNHPQKKHRDGKSTHENPPKGYESSCFRCGTKEH